ncbi:hypothetical protein [Streptomyces sp. NPDC004579]|uniref:hypothetical protein n=1 Tax=Streptomyces sp. NPDC004579 TaxID=3154667 RepID=UPI0033ABE9DD
MLSYLTATLPKGTSPAARLLALQCALRMNSHMQARLPTGLLRSLRLSTTAYPWQQLEQTRWLRTTPDNTTGITAELLDPTLLGQAPARPDRMHAAHWALLASSAPEARTLGPQAQLASVYLAAHTDPRTGNGLEELDQMARSCDTWPTELAHTLDQLTATTLLKTWQVSPYSGDLHWTLARTTPPRIR